VKYIGYFLCAMVSAFTSIELALDLFAFLPVFLTYFDFLATILLIYVKEFKNPAGIYKLTYN